MTLMVTSVQGSDKQITSHRVADSTSASTSLLSSHHLSQSHTCHPPLANSTPVKTSSVLCPVISSTAVASKDLQSPSFNPNSVKKSIPSKVNNLATSTSSNKRNMMKKSMHQSQDAPEDLLHPLDSTDRYGPSRFISKYINNLDDDLSTFLEANKSKLRHSQLTNEKDGSSSKASSSNATFSVAGRTIKEATRHIDAQGKKAAFGSQSMVNLACPGNDEPPKKPPEQPAVMKELPECPLTSHGGYGRSVSFIDTTCLLGKGDGKYLPPETEYPCTLMNRSPSATGIRSIIESQLAQEKEAITPSVRNQEVRTKRNKKRSGHKLKDVRDGKALTSPLHEPSSNRSVSQFSCLPSRSVYQRENENNAGSTLSLSVSESAPTTPGSASTSSSAAISIGQPVQPTYSSSKFHVDCPSERIHFYKTTVQLLRKGKKGTTAAWSAGPGLCSNGIIELVFKQELRDLIWLEVKGWMNNRTLIEEDNYLCSQRKKIPQTLEKILNFRFNPSCSSSSLPSVSLSAKQISSEVTNLRVDQNIRPFPHQQIAPPIQIHDNESLGSSHVTNDEVAANVHDNSKTPASSESMCHSTTDSSSVSTNSNVTTTSDLRAIISADVLAASVAMKLSIANVESTGNDNFSNGMNVENTLCLKNSEQIHSADQHAPSSAPLSKSDASTNTNSTSSVSTSNGSNESIADSVSINATCHTGTNITLTGNNYNQVSGNVSTAASTVAIASNAASAADSSSPSGEEENCFCSETLSRLCQSCVDKETEALEQVNRLIGELESCESLYPCTKALSYDYPHYSSDPLNSRIKSLYLFVNITRDMRQKITLLSKLFQITDLSAAGWPNFTHTSINSSVPPSAGATGGSSGGEESHDATPEIRLQTFNYDPQGYYTGYSSKLYADASHNSWTRNSSAASAAKHVHFQKNTSHKWSLDQPDSTVCSDRTERNVSAPDSPNILGGSNKGSPLASDVNDKHCNYFFRPKPSIYRRYVDKSLKHKGLRYIYHQLSHILRPLLYKVHAALKKPVSFSYADAVTSNANEWSSPHLSSGRKPLPISREYINELSNHGVWSSAYQQMALPTFHRPFLFLLRVTVDVVHECLRLRLEQQPENASAVSVSQLVRECREVIRAGVQIRQRYVNLAQTVLGEGGTDAIEAQLDTFDDDLKSMLQLYLRYLEQYMYFMRQISSQTSSTLRQKGYLEDEWKFVRNFCVHIPDGESLAANKFCRMASDLLVSIGEYLQSGLQESFNTFQESIEAKNVYAIKKGILHSCRGFKSILQEASSRAVQATAFAKSLRKDLEFAAEFKCNVERELFIGQLKSTGHIRIFSPSCVNYLMFVPASMQGSESCIWQLVDLTCGGRGVDSDVETSGYLLVFAKGENDITWQGATILLEPTVETSISLSHVQLDGILFVTNQPSNIEMQCRNFQLMMAGTVSMHQQHTSCNRSIVQSLTHLKEEALTIQDQISDCLAEISSRVAIPPHPELALSDALRSHCLDVCHLAFRFAFEYERALTRLITGDLKGRLSRNLMKTAVQWIKYFQSDRYHTTPKASRARWTNQGIQFLLIAIEPQFLMHLTDEEFAQFKSNFETFNNMIRDQQTYGPNVKPPSVYSSNLAEMSRPLAPSLNFQRSQSVTSVKGWPPFGQNAPVKQFVDAIATHNDQSSQSKDRQMADPKLSRLEQWTLSNKSLKFASSNRENEDKRESRIDNILRAVTKLDENRRSRLQKERVIGDVSTVVIQRAPLQLAARKVNFPWQRGFKIGEGRFGKVYTAVNSATGELIAMKEIHSQSNDQRALKETIDELRILEGIKHPNLVRYFGVEVHRDDLYIFMEYCNEGTLESAVQLHLPEQLVRKYTRQLLEAVNILHENGIVHRDIKSANILLTSDGTLKLGDFGCCMKLKNQTTMAGELSAFVGTPAYMAPEIFTRNNVEGHGRAADIWSIGCVVLEMMTGRRPWHDLDNSYQIMFKVGMGETPEIPDDLSEEAADFIGHCLHHDPRLRLSTCQLLSHPFTKADVEQEEER